MCPQTAIPAGPSHCEELGNGALFYASPQPQNQACIIIAHAAQYAGHAFQAPPGLIVCLPQQACRNSGEPCQDMVLSGGAMAASAPSYAMLLAVVRAAGLLAADEQPHLVWLRPSPQGSRRECLWLSELLRRVRSHTLQISRVSALLCLRRPERSWLQRAGRQAYQGRQAIQ